MKAICLFFQVHQPFRLRTYRFFDIGDNSYYYDEFQNRSIAKRVAARSYLPTNQIMLDIIKKHGDKFKVSYSISGSALDQFQLYAPEVIESFRALAKTGNVEFLAETYAHSLAALRSQEEFTRQVSLHREKIKELFGVTPTAFRNTEMIYSDAISSMVARMGFKVMLTEGAKHVLGWKSPNHMYRSSINPHLKVLLRNFQLSDDIAFRFSNKGWSEWPLTTEKFAGWINALDNSHEVVNIFADYETFGEHQSADTGIMDFLRALPDAIFKRTRYGFATPSQLAEELEDVAEINVPFPMSWADAERDLTAWLGNDLQDDAFDSLYSVEQKIKGCNNADLLRDWNYLQTSDHFYYMCTKWFSDGEVHKYFNPYPTPYEAYINYMNVLSDFIIRVDRICGNQQPVVVLSEPQSAAEPSAMASKRAARKATKVEKAGPEPITPNKVKSK